MKVCKRNCDCHYGVRYDQCECICPAWCGNDEFDYVLKEEPEPFAEITVEQFNSGLLPTLESKSENK